MGVKRYGCGGDEEGAVTCRGGDQEHQGTVICRRIDEEGAVKYVSDIQEGRWMRL